MATNSKEKQREYSRRHYAKHRAAEIARRTAWRAAHPDYWREYAERKPEVIKACAARHRKKHRKALRKRMLKYNQNKGAEYTARYRAKHRVALRERHARRRALEKRATPKWANLDAIEAIYADADRRKLEVDHVVPLQSKRVCGLHCEANLRPLSKRLNRQKNNRYWPGMWPIARANARPVGTQSH